MTDERQVLQDISEERPTSARIYDYMLGGYNNFEVDRVVGRQFVEILPDAPLIMQTNRAFLRRSVRFLTAQGIDQFLDIGSGIPTAGNVHEVAQGENPDARVVYVDKDPVAVRQSEEILKDNSNVATIEADARDVHYILENSETQRMLNFDKPVAVLILSVLLFVPDDQEAYSMVGTLSNALVPGSYLAISHGTSEGVPEDQAARALKLYTASGNPIKLRSRSETARFFEEYELVDPGVVRLPCWRPEGPEDLMIDRPESSGNYGAVGRKL